MTDQVGIVIGGSGESGRAIIGQLVARQVVVHVLDLSSFEQAGPHVSLYVHAVDAATQSLRS